MSDWDESTDEDGLEMMTDEEVEFQKARMRNANLIAAVVGIFCLVIVVSVWLLVAYGPNAAFDGISE